MLEMAMNQMFGGGSGGMGGAVGGMGGFGGGVGGILGTVLGTQIGKGLISLFGGLFANGGTFGTAERYANGGAFGTAQRFANGGAFTNSIVSSPTVFKFANGSKFGLMGEEGPEAIMPLARRSDGKLGVHVNGGGGGGSRSISIGDVVQNIKIEGGFTPESAIAMIRQGGEQTVAQIKRDLQSMLQQLDQDGTLG